MSESLAIETVDLRKRFDATDALRGLNLRVPQGSIFGFLGRNGAGKTTTIKLLLGMARPTAGQARVLGLPADDRECPRPVAADEGLAVVQCHNGLLAGQECLNMATFNCPPGRG